MFRKAKREGVDRALTIKPCVAVWWQFFLSASRSKKASVLGISSHELPRDLSRGRSQECARLWPLSSLFLLLCLADFVCPGWQLVCV